MPVHVSTKKAPTSVPIPVGAKINTIFLVLTFQMTKIWIYFISRGKIMKKNLDEIKF